MTQSDWQQNTSYGASSLEGDWTELWYGPVHATRNGSFVSLTIHYPSDERPRTLLLRADQLQDIIDSPHSTAKTIHGETYRTVTTANGYLDNPQPGDPMSNPWTDTAITIANQSAAHAATPLTDDHLERLAECALGPTRKHDGKPDRLYHLEHIANNDVPLLIREIVRLKAHQPPASRVGPAPRQENP